MAVAGVRPGGTWTTTRSCSPTPRRCWPAARRVPRQYIDGDLRDASVMLRAAAGTLDFTRPVALMLVGILHLIQDSEEPHRIVASLMDALPSGSYLAISHPASDINAGQAEAQRRYNERVRTPQTLRTRDEVTRFFEGLDLVPPGVVYVYAWRPDPGDAPPEGGVSAYGGVARKA